MRVFFFFVFFELSDILIILELNRDRIATIKVVIVN